MESFKTASQLDKVRNGFVRGTIERRDLVVYSYITLNMPELILYGKLSRVGSGKYLNGRPPGNTRCCRLSKKKDVVSSITTSLPKSIPKDLDTN